MTLSPSARDIYLDTQAPRGNWVYSGTVWIQWISMENARSVPHPNMPCILCPNVQQFLKRFSHDIKDKSNFFWMGQPIQSLYPLKVSQTGCTFTHLEQASQSGPRFHILSGPRVKMVMANNHSSTWANVIDWGWPMIVCGSVHTHRTCQIGITC
jgi:hypothetical protein